MPKSVFFFLKKRMKEFFAYALEFMLTFDKMHNTKIDQSITLINS